MEGAGEQCDFGDVINGDGCDQDCRFEMFVPGESTGVRDCYAEWALINPYNPDQLSGDPVPSQRQSCIDGDPSCDADGIVNDECRFRLALCFNVADPNLPDCETSEPLAKYVLEIPRPNASDAFRAANALALLAAFQRLSPVEPGGGNDNVLVFDPPLDLVAPDNCTATAEIVIPLGGQTTQDENLRGEVTAAAPPGQTTALQDRDTLRLVCIRP